LNSNRLHRHKNDSEPQLENAAGLIVSEEGNIGANQQQLLKVTTTTTGNRPVKNSKTTQMLHQMMLEHQKHKEQLSRKLYLGFQ
jgi:hypothetical protein